MAPWDPFYLRGLALIEAWLSHHTPSKVGYEIAYPFSNFNDEADEGKSWVSVVHALYSTTIWISGSRSVGHNLGLFIHLDLNTAIDNLAVWPWW